MKLRCCGAAARTVLLPCTTPAPITRTYASPGSSPALARLTTAYDRVSMHGVRRRLVEDQAEALGLPLEFVVVPSHDTPNCPMTQDTPGTDFPPNDVYSRTILAALARLKEDGIEVVVFGDIFLEDLRAYRDKLLAFAGLEGRYPLWGRETAGLFDEFVALGYRAVVVCVDTGRLSAGSCGQLLTPDFRRALPEGVDPCGERGEYHTFVFDGPLFRRPVPFTLGEVHQHEPFAFQELLPAELATPLRKPSNPTHRGVTNTR
jgi:diphthamide synthase (EF-2-diphthine--ammonia ligase)